jgi:hypothetical protein
MIRATSAKSPSLYGESSRRWVGARQMDIKQHQLAVALKEMVPDPGRWRTIIE